MPCQLRFYSQKVDLDFDEFHYFYGELGEESGAMIFCRKDGRQKGKMISKEIIMVKNITILF